MDPCVNCVIGDFGTGKTLFMTALAYQFSQYKDDRKRKIFANFKLIGIDYTPMSFKKIATFPAELHDAIVFIDEGHVGFHAYDFFSKDVKMASIFISQIRKRNVIIFWSSQLFKKVAKPLRDYTHYSYELYKVHPVNYTRLENGKPFIYVFDLFNNRFLNQMELDLTPFFNKFDTKEIITE